MSEDATEAVTTQPKGMKRTEVRDYVRKLDASTVLDWTPEEVVEKFLKPCGMGYLDKSFIQSHINGGVLIALQESHLKDLGCDLVGHRLMLMDYIQVLKKHKKDFDRSAPLWTVTTPAAGCGYHPSCGSYMKFMCCHCCVSFTDWRVTGQGIRWRKNRAAIDICGQSETQFIDYRFMKDIELREFPRCLCCCMEKELLIYADDKDATSVRQSVSTYGHHMVSNAPLIICHPDARAAEEIIRNAWAEAQLVSD